MNTDRYDIEAGKNILNVLKRASPRDHARLMAQLRGQAGLQGLGATDESEPGFWSRIFSAGTNALEKIADYKIAEQVAGTEAEVKQAEYERVVATEMERQAALAARAQTRSLEYENQMEYLRQKSELERAAQKAKSKLNWALIAVGGLVGLWALTRAFA